MFDLDGTLIHSMPGIIAALRRMMQDMGLPERDDAYMSNLIGPPFQLGFSKYLGLDQEEIRCAIDIYTGYTKDIFKDPAMLAPFPETLDLLQTLHKAGAFVGIVTSKGARPARDQLAYFGFMPSLQYIRSGDDHGNGDKTQLLRETCEELGRESLVMVGDRFYDLEAASLCGVDSIAVSYGYGSQDEIAACHPTYTVDSVKALKALLLNE